MEGLSANVVPACGTTELDSQARHSQHAHLKCICFQITPCQGIQPDQLSCATANGL